jgi:aspartate aminotransferase
VDAVNKLMVNSCSCVASFTQRAGIAALYGPQEPVDVNRIPGFRCTVPGGAFYAYANAEGTGIPSKQMADLLLEEAGVAALNGGAFGDYDEGYIRFSYANSLENLTEAVARIETLAHLLNWRLRHPLR